MYARVRRAILIYPLLLTVAAALAATTTEPRNLSLLKQELADYASSGAYLRDVAAVAASANEFLSKRIPAGPEPGRKLAVVFDIDETLLSNLDHMAANDYGYMPKVWNDWVAKGRVPVLVPVRTIYDTALRGKVAIFILTGRSVRDQSSTERNLQRAGYRHWTRIIYRPANTAPTVTNAAFKTAIRRELTGEGYTIIANIGDQESDLANGYAERTFKLPNPFYLYD